MTRGEERRGEDRNEVRSEKKQTEVEARTGSEGEVRRR